MVTDLKSSLDNDNKRLGKAKEQLRLEEEKRDKAIVAVRNFEAEIKMHQARIDHTQKILNTTSKALKFANGMMPIVGNLNVMAEVRTVACYQH